MENSKLIKKLEQISLNIPDRILIVKGYVKGGSENEYLEIIIFKGFSSSTTHPINPDLEKNVINSNFILSKCQLFKAPLLDQFNKILKESDEIELFLNIDYWY